MSEAALTVALVAVLSAWLWREREHAQERAKLIERLTGVSLAKAPKRCNRRWTPRREAQVAKQREGG